MDLAFEVLTPATLQTRLLLIALAALLRPGVDAEAADGEEALAFFESGGTAEVAILDLMMPGINGLELARRLRRAVPHVRVVLTSAYHLSERQIARADVGAVGFVPKPYHLDELAEFLRRKQAVAS